MLGDMRWHPPITGAAGLKGGKAPALSWWRLAAYTGTGIVSGAVNLIVFHLALYAHFGAHAAWALAFEIGSVAAFLLHRYVTWRIPRVDTLHAIVRQFWQAQAGSLVAAVLNLVVFTILIRLGLTGELADAAGLATGFMLNFYVARSIYGPDRLNERRYRSSRT